MRRALLLFLGLLLAPATWAKDEASTATIDLTGATVLASPGVPEGLFPFLPGGKAPPALTWPLPDGPVLALGLPRTDAAARDLAFFYDLLGPTEDLGGGYLVAAWHDGTRPIGVILADDAVALMAARFELESVPRRQGMEALDFTRPPAEAGLHVRRGRHAFRPRFRIRAYAPLEATAASVLTAIAGRANRYWFTPKTELAPLLPRLARHGVEPCVVLEVDEEESTAVVARAEPWVRRGVRRVVIRPPTPWMTESVARRQLEALHAAFDLQEVLLDAWLPRLPGTTAVTDLPRFRRPHQDLASIRARAQSGPLLVVDTWARSSLTPVPSRPRHRPAGLGRLVDGVVVLGGPGAREVLGDAWAPGTEDTDEWETVLLPLLPRRPLAPRAFLEETIARLDALDAPTRQAVDWLDPLLEDLRSSLGTLTEPALLVPRVPATVVLDGRLDEPAWSHAARMEVFLPDDPAARTATLLLVADGHDLHVALRCPADVAPPALVVSPKARDLTRYVGLEERGPASWPRRLGAGVCTWEGTLGHFALSGDAHPTRVLHLWIRPERGEPQRVASLVLGP